MTVATEIARSGPYAGAGTVGPFTAGFRFLSDSHLQVVKNAAGVETTLVLTTDYTVAGAGAATGTVTLIVALAVGETLTIVRKVPFTQDADYVANDTFPAESHEQALDKLTMQTQQLKETVSRSLTAAISTPAGVSAALPPPEALKILGWNSTGTALVNTDPSGAAAVLEAVLALFSASTGATLSGWIRTAAGAVATTLSKWLNRQPLSVTDFMSDAQIADTQLATPLLDHTAAIQAFRDAYAASTRKKKGVFPAGRYRYSLSPNWAIQDSNIVAEGEVRLRYFGTGDAVVINADAADAVDPVPGLIYNCNFGTAENPFLVECPSTAGHAVWVQSFHHSRVHAKVLGAGTSKAGLKTNFAVCSVLDVRVSVNEEGWYLGSKPAIGMDLDKRGANEQTSYCTIPNPLIEGPTTGIQLTNTLGNVFVGGTSEGCSSYGVYAAAGASGDKFIGTDFEANVTADAYVLGTGITFDKCDSDNIINFGTTAVQGHILGGRHKSILLDTSSSFCTVSKDTVYNRSNNGGTMTDGGTNNLPGNPLNAGTGVRFLTVTELAYNPANIPTGTMLQKTVTVTGAKLGDKASASFSISLAAAAITAAVTAADTVTVCFINLSGGGVDLGPGDLSVTVTRGA